MNWGLPAPHEKEPLKLAYKLGNKAGTGVYAATYLDPGLVPPTPFPTLSCWSLSKTLWGFCTVAEDAADKIVKQGTGPAGVPDMMAGSFLKMYGETRSRRYQALVAAWSPFAVLPVVRQHLTNLTNWYVDSWGKENLGEWHLTREKSYATMLANRPRLRESIRDLLCAQWLFLAEQETAGPNLPPPPPPSAPLTAAHLIPGVFTMPQQYFALLYASLQPLAGNVSPQLIGPFATPAAATTAATQLAGLVSQLGGYAFGQPAALNPATNAWQWLSQGVAMMPQQRPGNWGGW